MANTDVYRAHVRDEDLFQGLSDTRQGTASGAARDILAASRAGVDCAVGAAHVTSTLWFSALRSVIGAHAFASDALGLQLAKRLWHAADDAVASFECAALATLARVDAAASSATALADAALARRGGERGDSIRLAVSDAGSREALLCVCRLLGRLQQETETPVNAVQAAVGLLHVARAHVTERGDRVAKRHALRSFVPHLCATEHARWRRFIRFAFAAYFPAPHLMLRWLLSGDAPPALAATAHAQDDMTRAGPLASRSASQRSSTSTATSRSSTSAFEDEEEEKGDDASTDTDDDDSNALAAGPVAEPRHVPPQGVCARLATAALGGSCPLALRAEDLVAARAGSAGVYRPGYFVTADATTRSVVVTVRGTFHLADVLVDLVCEQVPFACSTEEHVPLDGAPVGMAHRGFLIAARALAEELHDVVTSALDARPGFALVVTGHSMGAGIATLLTLIWAQTQALGPRRSRESALHCFAFGAPCSLCHELSQSSFVRRFVTSVVVDDDFVARLSFSSVNDVRRAVAALAGSHGLSEDARRGLLRALPEGADAERLHSGGRVWLLDAQEMNRNAMQVDPRLLLRSLELSPGFLWAHNPWRYMAAIDAAELHVTPSQRVKNTVSN